jgi:5'-3' exonuclease
MSRGFRESGKKPRLGLLQQFESLDGVYRHLDEVKGSVKEKLRAHEKEARLSRDLVILDRHVPSLWIWPIVRCRKDHRKSWWSFWSV